jgi:prevent-host-death family protein
VTKTLPISEARTHLPDLVEAARRTMERVVITKNGKPEAVLMGHDEYESWVETLDILSNPEEVEAIRAGEEALERGEVLSFEEVFGHPQGERPRRSADPEAREVVPMHLLSGRELEVLQLLATGVPLKGIGERLGLSATRVEAFKEVISKKLGLAKGRAKHVAKTQRRTAHQARR